MIPEGKPARREDGLLDKISELKAKRDSALIQVGWWELEVSGDEHAIVSAELVHEMLDDIRLRLL